MIFGQSQPPPATVEDLLGPDLAARLDRLDLLSRKVLAGKLPGERRSKRRGRSVEFDDFREYVPGDDPRHIDWNAFARLDRLVIKLFREEEDLSLHLVLDASASMDAGEPGKLLYAARLALALGYLALVNQNRVSVSAFGRAHWPGGVRRATARRGRRSVQALGAFVLDLLREASRRGRDLGSDPPAPFAQSMRAVAAGRSPRGIVVLLSDFLFDEDPGPGLSFLTPAAAMDSVDTYAVQVLSPAELDPARDFTRGLAGDLRLTDAESGRGEDVTVTPTAVASYRAALARHQARLRDLCMARGIAWVPLSTATPIADVVTTTLRRGGMLR